MVARSRGINLHLSGEDYICWQAGDLDALKLALSDVSGWLGFRVVSDYIDVAAEERERIFLRAQDGEGSPPAAVSAEGRP